MTCPVCGETGHDEMVLVGGIVVIGCPKLTGDQHVYVAPLPRRTGADIDHGDDWADCTKPWGLT